MNKKNLFFLIIIGFFYISKGEVVSFNKRQLDSIKEQTVQQISLSRIYLKSDFNLAVDAAIKATELADIHAGLQLRLQAWKNLGYIYQTNKLDSTTIHAYMTYLDIARKSGEPIKYADALDIIGSLHVLLGNYSKAIHYYKHGLSIHSQNKDTLFSPARLVVSYQNLFIAFKEKGMLDSAIKYAYKAYDICKADQLQFKEDLAKTRILLADLHLALAEPQQAKVLIEMALPDIEDLGLLIQRNLGYYFYALALKELNQKTLAFEWIHKAIDATLQSGHRELLFNIHEKLSHWYAEENQLDKAYYHLRQSDSMKELHFTEEASYALAQEEIKAELHAEVHEERQKYRLFSRKMLFLLGSSFFIIAIISFFVRRLYFKTRHTLDALKSAGEKVEELISLADAHEHKLKQQSVLIEKKSLQELHAISLLDQAIDSISNLDEEGMQKRKDKVLELLAKAKDNKTWEEFELHFHQIHNGFFNRLHQKHPQLSPNERKLCAFLMMNMSTKEIANLTGQTLRAVELARIRLRKKLQLTHSDLSLPQFLLTI